MSHPVSNQANPDQDAPSLTARLVIARGTEAGGQTTEAFDVPFDAGQSVLDGLRRDAVGLGVPRGGPDPEEQGHGQADQIVDLIGDLHFLIQGELDGVSGAVKLVTQRRQVGNDGFGARFQ